MKFFRGEMRMYQSIEDVRLYLKKFLKKGYNYCTYQTTKTISGFETTLYLEPIKGESANGIQNFKQQKLHFVKPRGTRTKIIIKHLGDADLKIIVDSDINTIYIFKR